MPLPFSLLLWYDLNMKKSIGVVPKKRGRPATGRDPVTAIRLSPEMRAQLMRGLQSRKIDGSALGGYPADDRAGARYQEKEAAKEGPCMRRRRVTHVEPRY